MIQIEERKLCLHCIDMVKNTHTLVAGCHFNFPLMVASNEGRLGRGFERNREKEMPEKFSHELPSNLLAAKSSRLKNSFFWLKGFSPA